MKKKIIRTITGCFTVIGICFDRLFHRRIKNIRDALADGVLNIGVDDTYLPMEFRDDQNELVGFDIDFANALAEELGVK